MHPYQLTREAFAAAVASMDPTTLVPACPDWTVHQLLAHQVHQLRGALDGSFPLDAALSRVSGSDITERLDAAARQQAWITRGVQELSVVGVGELLEVWADLCHSAPPSVRDALVPDVVVHLFDLFGVIGSHAYRQHDIVVVALNFWADVAGEPIPDDWSARFELLRAITGRRSRDQAPNLNHEVAVYGWRSEPLIE